MNLFVGGDLKIEQDIPGTLNPGQEILVTVEVDKGELKGFAKLQLEIPTGMTVTAVETQGASFTFADQKVKFIWMALPPSEKFSITYNLALSPIAIGTKDITGKFSYIEDNERKTYDLPLYSVEVGEGGLTASESEKILMNEPQLPSLNGEDAIGAAAGFSIPLEPAIQGPGGIEGERTITKISDFEYLVEVALNKKNVRGFGKLQETIPAGFTATEKESNDAIFTTQGEIVKFVWLNLPPQEMLNISYQIRGSSAVENEYKIDGQFGYLLNDETQKATLASTPFRVGSDVLVSEMPGSTEPVTTEVEPEVTSPPSVAEVIETEANEPVAQVAEVVKQQEVQAESEIKETMKQEAPVTPVNEPTPAAETVSNIPDAETGVTYKVQITASHKDVGREYFISRHKYHGDFGIERHQGWIKYLTGKYGAYTDAKSRRNALVSAGHKFPGPFVTAYNDGERITVQEALMISNQKWVQ